MALTSVQSEASDVWQDTVGLSGSPVDYVRRMSADLGTKEPGATFSSAGTIPVKDFDPQQTATAGIAPVIDTPNLSPITGAVSYRDLHQAQRRIFNPPLDLSFYPLQEWEGYVLDIQTETFTARLVDKTADRSIEEEIGEFPISDLADDDRELLKRGAIFRWTIGYQRTKGATKKRVSGIVFRRLPLWTKADIENAKSRAAKLAAEIQWE